MENDTRDTHQATPAEDSSQHGLSLSALQRRRVLLRGVGKGAAVVAAAVPVQTFAANILKTQGPPDRLCTVSGVGSVLPSSAPRIDGVCRGDSATTWRDAADTAWPFAKATQFKDIFIGDGSTKTFLELMSGMGTVRRRNYARAYLNAHAGHPTTFPYTKSEVLGMYKLTGNAKTAADNFFSLYV